MRLPAALSCPFFLAILFGVLAADARAQCRVEGVVRTADGKPYAGATVQIDAGEYKKPVTTTAGPDGRYVFADVKAGSRVRLIALSGGRPIALEWTLVTRWVETVDLTEVIDAPSPNSLQYVLATDGPAGEVAGYVHSGDGVPANARVTINQTFVSAATDGAGRYAIGGLRAGSKVDVHATAPGFRAASEGIVVREGERVTVDFTLVRDAPGGGGSSALGMVSPSADSGTVVVRPDQFTGVPGVNRNDPFRVLQLLPGVLGTVDAVATLWVRGSSSGQTPVTMDSISLYQMADPASGPTPFNMDTIDSAVFAKSPSRAGDGGELGGNLRLAGAAASRRPTGFIDLSPLGASAQLQIPAGQWFSGAVSLRGSPTADIYNDTLTRFGPRDGAPVRDREPWFTGGALPGIPLSSSYRDVNARFDVRPTGRDRIAVSVYDGENDLNDSYDQAIEAPAIGTLSVAEETGLPDDAVIQASRGQRWTSRGWSGSWSRAWSPRASTSVSLARSEYSRTGGQAWVLTSAGSGQDYSYLRDRGGSSALTESNDIAETTFRADNSIGLGFAHQVSFGAEVSTFEANYTARSEVAGVGPADGAGLVDLLQQSGTGRTTAIYAADAWRANNRLVLTPGVRLVRYDLADATYLEPRVSASYEVQPELHLTGGWSLDHQAVNRITREDRANGDGGFWALSDGVSIPVASAQQIAGGVIYARADLSFELNLFYKRFDDITMFAPRLYAGVQPANGVDALYTGYGTARGGEAILQHKTPRNGLWLMYTLSNTDHVFTALEPGVFPASYDQINEIKAADAFQIMPRWTVSGSFTAGSGRPYTSATSVRTVWFPTGIAVSQVVFGNKNATRLPGYHRLDLSTRRDFVTGRVTTSLGATVFNVYDQDSTVGVHYDSIAGALAAYEVQQMGRAINAFLRVSF